MLQKRLRICPRWDVQEVLLHPFERESSVGKFRSIFLHLFFSTDDDSKWVWYQDGESTLSIFILAYPYIPYLFRKGREDHFEALPKTVQYCTNLVRKYTLKSSIDCNYKRIEHYYGLCFIDYVFELSSPPIRVEERSDRGPSRYDFDSSQNLERKFFVFNKECNCFPKTQ